MVDWLLSYWRSQKLKKKEKDFKPGQKNGEKKRVRERETRGSREDFWPLMRVRNSSCLTLLLCMPILRVSSRVNRNLFSSYKPRAAYLCTSKVMYSIMLAIRLLVIGLFEDLLPKRKTQGYKVSTKMLWHQCHVNLHFIIAKPTFHGGVNVSTIWVWGMGPKWVCSSCRPYFNLSQSKLAHTNLIQNLNGASSVSKIPSEAHTSSLHFRPWNGW